jgi:NADH-quinone oxidoreductase subunit N
MNAIIISALFGVLMMFASAFLPKAKSYVPLALTGVFIVLFAAVAEYNNINLLHIDTQNMLLINDKTILFSIIISICVVMYLLLNAQNIEKVGQHKAEYFTLLFFIMCGIFIVISFANLIMLFIGIEIISIPLYVLASSDKRNLKSNEAGLKYFLLGSFSTGIMLLGIAFLYGGTGSFVLDYMVVKTGEGTNYDGATVALTNAWTVIGMMLIFASLAFKVSVAPFHFWTPDVYDGSPTVFTSFMSTIVKVAIFLAFMKLFHNLFGVLQYKWMQYAAFATALTLIIGNVTAVFQQSVKRMLAYSSIAQAGFMMFGVMVLHTQAYEGIYLYAIAYSFATIGIFAVLQLLNDYTFDGFNGLAKSNPLLAACTTVFLLSLAGIPLTAGFFAKYYMLSAAVKGGVYMWLIILAVICAAISVYYYFKVIQAMYFKQGNPIIAPLNTTFKVTLVIAAIAIIAIGVFPNIITSWMQ